MVESNNLETLNENRSMLRCFIKESKNEYKKFLKLSLYGLVIVVILWGIWYGSPTVISWLSGLMPYISILTGFPWYYYIIGIVCLIPAERALEKCIIRESKYWTLDQVIRMRVIFRVIGLMILTLSLPLLFILSTNDNKIFSNLLITIIAPITVVFCGIYVTGIGDKIGGLIKDETY